MAYRGCDLILSCHEAETDHAKWLETRNAGIGGSDAEDLPILLTAAIFRATDDADERELLANQVLRTVRNFSYLAKAKKAEQEEEKPAGIDCSGLIRD